MLGYEEISDLVVSWALRRGESVGARRADGIDENLSEALDRLGRLVWARLQEDSAWTRPDGWSHSDRSRTGKNRTDTSPLTKFRVQLAIEAAADRDRAFWYSIHALAGEVQELARNDPESARAVGITIEPETDPTNDGRRELTSGGLLSVAGVALAVLMAVVVGVRVHGPTEAAQVASDGPGRSGTTSGQQRSQERGGGQSEGRSEGRSEGQSRPNLGPASTATDRNGVRYRVRSSAVRSSAVRSTAVRSTEVAAGTDPDGRTAPTGATFLSVDLEFTNLGARAATLEPAPVTLSVPLALTDPEDDGCRLGEAPGRPDGAGHCLIALTSDRSPGPLDPSGTTTLTYGTREPVPAGLDSSKITVRTEPGR